MDLLLVIDNSGSPRISNTFTLSCAFSFPFPFFAFFFLFPKELDVEYVSVKMVVVV